MLEYPEILIITQQMNEVLIGKSIESGEVISKNSNLFIKETDIEQYRFLCDGVITEIDTVSPDIYIKANNGYGILICQSGGKLLYNENNNNAPKSINIRFNFKDKSSLTYTMKLFSLGIFTISHDIWEKMKQNTDKFDPTESLHNFQRFLISNSEFQKMQIKKFLSTHVMGIMNSLAAEILLFSGIYPSTTIKNINDEGITRIYQSMQRIVKNVMESGGKESEVDLFNHKGKYVVQTSRKRIGESCPVCGTIMEKNTAGGVTAYCCQCQKKS